MHGGVFYGETFGSRGSVEVPVGGNQRYRPETGIPLEPVDFEDDSRLYGIVSPEPVLAGCQHRLGKERAGQLNDPIVLGQMAAEVTENCSGLGSGEIAGVLPASDRGSDLNGGNAGDINPVASLGTDEGFNPGAAGFVHMAFDEGAGIEEVIRHLNGARG